MEFSRTHLITWFLLALIPCVASFSFNLTDINTSNQNREIVLEGEGSYISNEGIRVTPNEIGVVQQQRAGRATYIRQLHLWDNTSGELASFSTNFTFAIQSSDEWYGDGLTFFLAQNSSIIGGGGAMGLPVNVTWGTSGFVAVTSSRFVAVEFDTFWNPEWDPVIDATTTSTLRGDHVGISISSLTSIRSQIWLNNISDGRECQAWIRYDSGSKNLSISFTGYLNNTVVRQDGLVYTVDLRRELPEWVIFGFSAATGARFQKNNVKSWSFNSSNLQIDEKKMDTTKPRAGVGGREKQQIRVISWITGCSCFPFNNCLCFVEEAKEGRRR